MEIYKDIAEIAEQYTFPIWIVRDVYLATGDKQLTMEILETSLVTGVHHSLLIKPVVAEMYEKNMAEMYDFLHNRKWWVRLYKFIFRRRNK